uniref:SFRICE_020444 n=1 Tax=Spodoptera frugiperda TaxID=7108 RepID=A0A2H1V1I1_SPOFR
MEIIHGCCYVLLFGNELLRDFKGKRVFRPVTFSPIWKALISIEGTKEQICKSWLAGVAAVWEVVTGLSPKRTHMSDRLTQFVEIGVPKY